MPQEKVTEAAEITSSVRIIPLPSLFQLCFFNKSQVCGNSKLSAERWMLIYINTTTLGAPAFESEPRCEPHT